MLLPDDAAVARRDSGLLGLATLLDAEALASCIASHPGLAAERVDVISLRYRPGSSAIASLQLIRNGGSEFASAHAWGDRAPDLTRVGRGLVLPDLQLAVCPLTDDLRLPSLSAALDPAPLLEALMLPPATDAGTLETLAYRPERRFTARIGAPATDAYVLKFYRRGGFRRALERQRWRADEPDLAAQRFLGSSESHACVALAWHPGQPLALRMRAGEALATLLPAVEDCARCLADLHQRSAPTLPADDDTELDAQLAKQLATLAALDPGLAEEAEAALQVPLAGRTSPDATRHGDFHAKQALTTESGALLLDLDDACRGEPERDLACFSAHLRRDAALGRIESGAADAIDAHFLAAYAETSPGVSAARVRGLTRRLLAGMASYPFRVRQPEWRRLSRSIVAAARALPE